MANKAVNKLNQNRKPGTGKSRKSKRSKRMARILIIDAAVLCTILTVYLIFAFYYNNHFFGNTIVNGVNTSNMSEEKAERVINDQVSSYVLEIKQRNGVSDFIYGSNINLHTDFDTSLSELIHKQGGLLWPTSLFREKEYEVGTLLTYDEKVLTSYVDLMKGLKDENMTEPINATIAYGENGYEIVPENPGTKVIKEKLYEAVIEAINTLQPTLSLEEAGIYEEPKITSENPGLSEAIKEMNRIANTKITYEFGAVTEVLDGSKISEWLSYDENFEVTLNEDKIKEYVDYIGKTYNSFGRRRTFKTSYGDEIKVEGGDYGWWLDRPSEVKELTELIRNGEQTVKEPVYFQTAQQYGDDDIGDTYVEVNLTAQHLFFYKDGKLVVEADFVSGNVSKDYATPTGTYPVQYKENDAILVGEDYETPVKYWMPFNKNIGFHDAVWRDEFGKDIYLTRGSHGCINMPPKAAKKMFENIKRGVAVVVYELPGTESVKEEKPKTEKPKAEKPKAGQ
jgi:vancomycin resistance protein YoaR